MESMRGELMEGREQTKAAGTQGRRERGEH